ncbi:hypothetical protein ACVWZA_002499 [Sphingomonas sp. UYAg733]
MPELRQIPATGAQQPACRSVIGIISLLQRGIGRRRLIALALRRDQLLLFLQILRDAVQRSAQRRKPRPHRLQARARIIAGANLRISYAGKADTVLFYWDGRHQ